MEIIELILDEEDEFTGIEAVSIVHSPAIEARFIALKDQQFSFAKVDEEKKILMGPALIPGKPIFRKRGDHMFYVYFSQATVKRASELFFINGNQNNATLEHEMDVRGLTVVESWIVEDPEMDKSKKYGFDVPEGTWMISMKVENDKIWEEQVKEGKVLGFSIEGYFADKATIQKPNLKAELQAIEDQEAEHMLESIKETFNDNEIKLETYNDYPEAVSNNAKRGIELNDKVNNKCATSVGKIRATQLRDKKNLSVQTIKRMYSYLSRAAEYYDEGDSTACGTISYLLWGGKAGLRWSESKLKELGELNLTSMVIDKNFAIIDDRLAYKSKEKAEEMAENIGCKGFHIHQYEGEEWFMPCEQHALAEVGPKGGIKKSPKAPGSATPNPNPKGEGTAKGDASTSRGAKVSKQDEETLKKKSDEFNERYKNKLGYGVTVGQLKTVFQRGLGAFNTSHSPRVKSPKQWALARVNAYLYLVKNGRPQNPKYTTDYDLLPSKHPKSPKNK